MTVFVIKITEPNGSLRYPCVANFPTEEEVRTTIRGIVGDEPSITIRELRDDVALEAFGRDWVECSITLKRGLTGAKPEMVCHWAFEMAGARPEDELADLYPGTGAVSRAWQTWQMKFALPLDNK